MVFIFKARYEKEYEKDKRNYEKKLNEYKKKKTNESVNQSASKENTIDEYQQRQEMIITIKKCTDQMIDLSIEEPKFIK